MPGRVIYLVRSWPRLSQTFVLDEVLALERRGLDLAVFSLVRSGERIVQPRVRDVRAPVTYLEDRRRRSHRDRARTHLRVLATHPLRYVRTLLFCLHRPRLTAGYSGCSLRGCFAHAVEVTSHVDHLHRTSHAAVHLHAHFAHDPTLVALLVGRLTGLPFSFTAHARDLLQIPAASLRTRAAEASTLVTCCRANADYIASVVPASRRPPVLVVHHGVALDRFAPTPHAAAPVPSLLSVGRLVEKKGYADLLQALARLAASGVPFHCCIYGDGPLREHLVGLRDGLGLRERVTMPGAVDQERVRQALGSADVFVLTPRLTEDGDRDGIPNVLVEAMACGLPVVTTSAGGITELVRHGDSGLVTAPGDTPAIAGCLRRLVEDPSLRTDLGRAARRAVERDYDLEAAARALDALFRPAPSIGLAAP
jgi:glycosyltransferase involved in cell wall biosynthesis